MQAQNYVTPLLRDGVGRGMVPDMKMKNARRDSLIAWMSGHDLKAASVARAAQIPYTTLKSFLDGKTNEMLGVTEQKIADAYDLPVESIFARERSNHIHGIEETIAFKKPSKGVGLSRGANVFSKTYRIPVVGKVQAGAWAMVPDVEHPIGWVDYDGQLPEGAVVLIVAGDSADKVYSEGTRLIVIPAALMWPEHEDFVVLWQFDSTGKVETTVKQAMIVNGVTEFWPRSNNPLYQTPITIKPRDEADQDGPSIFGVVWDHIPARKPRSGIRLPL